MSIPIWHLLFIVAFLNFGVGLAVLRRDWRASINWAFLWLTVGIGGWVLACSVLMTVSSERSAIFWYSFAHVMGIWIGVSLWMFACLFINALFSKTRLASVVFLTLAASILKFWPNIFSEKAVLHAGAPDVFIRPWYHIAFVIFFSAFFFRGLHLLFRYSRGITNRRLARRQAMCIAWGAATMAVGGIFFNIVLLSPYIQQQQFIWVGPLFSIFFILSSYYTKTRYFFGIPKAADAVVLEEDLPKPFAFVKDIGKLIKEFWRVWKVRIVQMD